MEDYSSSSSVPWSEYISSIKSIIIKSGVTSIGSYAFFECTNIESVYISSTVTSIGDYAFYDCTSLTKIFIGCAMQNIGDSAFYGCSSLQSITCLSQAPPTIYDSTFSDEIYSSATLYASGNRYSSNWSEYPYAEYWSEFSNIVALTCGDNLTWLFEYGTLIITGSGDMYDYTSDTLPWSNCATEITAISLPSEMTSIGDYAFYNCSSVSSITIPDAVTTIGNYAFYNCDGITSIAISDAVTTIGTHVFCSCGALASVTLPETLESLGEYMFYACSKLTSITLPETLTGISNGAFGNTALTSITIPDNVTSIGDSAFFYCDDFNSAPTLPDNITSIGNYAFYYCGKSVPTLPANLITIGEYAFYYCSSCNVTIPDKVKSIGKYAFYGAASSSYSLVLGSSVEYIGDRAFSDGYFKKITSSNPTPPACYSSNVFGSYTYKNTYLYAESNLYEQAYVWEDFSRLNYTSTAKTEISTIIGICGDDLTYTLSLSDSTLVIEGTGDMYDYGDNSRAPWYNYAPFITSITLPDAMTSVGDYAFYNCESITSIDLPSSLTSIGDYAFYDCDALTSIVIPNKVTTIGSWAFYDCYELTSVTLGSSVATIGDYAFYSCDKLSSINLPSSLTSLGKGAFRYCYALTSIVIPDNVTTIGEETFYYCSDMTTLTIGSGVETIGEDAFYGCSALTSVTSLNVTPPTCEDTPFSSSTYTTATLYPASLDYYTAEYWEKFGSIIYKVSGSCGDNLTWSFNDGTLTIGGSGDMYSYSSTDEMPWADIASAVTNIIIKSSVTSICDSAFYACENIETVNSYSTTPPTLAESAFNTTTYSSATLGVTSTAYLRADNWNNFSTMTTISASDEPEDDTSGNAIADIHASNSTIRAIDNAIAITTSIAQTAQVYSLAGQSLVKQAIAKGETIIEMPTSGVYVVVLTDGTKAKVLVK